VAEPAQFGRRWNAYCGFRGRSLLQLRRTAQHERGGPMKSILDPSFRYTKSVETDLRKTFARVRREIRRQQQEQSKVSVDVATKILRFNSRNAALEVQGVRSKQLSATGGKLKDL
jgi:hypothetical protein